MDGPPPLFKSVYPPFRTSGSVSPTSIQSSDLVHFGHGCNSPIDERNDQPGPLRNPATGHNSLHSKETPTHSVSTTPTAPYYICFQLDTDQSDGSVHDQSPDTPLLDPKDPTEGDVGLWLDSSFDDDQPPGPFNTRSLAPLDAGLWLDIPFDDERPPGPFNTCPVAPHNTGSWLDIPLDDEQPPGRFNTRPVSSPNTGSWLDIPLDDERPPGPFNTRSVARLDPGSWLDIPLDDERPHGLFNTRFAASPDAGSWLDTPFDDERPPDPFNWGFVSRPRSLDMDEGEHSQEEGGSDSDLQYERLPNPLNRSSLHVGTRKRVSDTLSSLTDTSDGRPGDSAISFLSLTQPLFS